MNVYDAYNIITLLSTTIGHLYINEYWGRGMKETQEAIAWIVGASLFYMFTYLCWVVLS